MNNTTDLDITNTDNPVAMTLIDWYPPAFKAGGPVKSVANLCDLLGDSMQFKVVTGSEDIDGTDLKTTKNEWVSGKSGEKIMYLSNENKRKKIQHLIQNEPYSILHINGLFSFYYSILPLIITLKKRKQIKLIVSPRGMLSPSALKIKRLKKNLFLFFSKFFGLYHQVTWHATSEKEVQEIRKHFGQNETLILAPNIPTKPELSVHQLPKVKNKLHIVSITRISPIKNLHLIFEYLKGIGTENQVKFSLYGPSEDKEYKSILKQLASELPSNIEVSFCGTIEPQKIPEVFSNNHLFILPTQGENYGHAIVEALSNGIPVLISDQTPWKNLKVNNAGFDLSLNASDKWIATLQFFLDMNDSDWNEWRKGAFQFAVQNYKSEQMMEQYKKLYAN